jgi:hypothetical protein
MGRQLSFFFENEKPALVQQINAEFEKLGKKVLNISCNFAAMKQLLR